MNKTLLFYLVNIFIHPIRAAQSIMEERKLWPIIISCYLIGVLSYIIIVLLGYQELGWADFPYKEYYPYYFSPFWWEVFVVPIWGLMIACAFGIPAYFLGRIFGGTATFMQTIALVLLASIVSLLVFNHMIMAPRSAHR